MLLFIPSLQLTSVANVAIILRPSPFAAAALAWVWFRETPRARTVLPAQSPCSGSRSASAALYGSSDMSGVVLACLMMLAIAGMTVAARRYRDTPLIAAAALSNFLGSCGELAVCAETWRTYRRTTSSSWPRSASSRSRWA